MRLKIAITTALALVLLLILGNSHSKAQVVCQPVYGGGETCVTRGNILLDKKVLNPQTNRLVDNLGVNDSKYQPDFLIAFQIALTNTGNTALDQVNVKDILPQFVTFRSGGGNFDQATKTLSFSINNLKPNETRRFTVTGRIVKAEELPATQGIVCVVNQAIAQSNDSSSRDNAQFCIEKKVLSAQAQAAPKIIKETTKNGLPVKNGFPVFPAPSISTIPSTGSETLILFSLLPMGIAGLYLRKLTKRIGTK